MPISKPTLMRSYSSLLAQSLKNWKVSFSSSTRHFMVSNLVVKSGQKASMIALRTWDSCLPKKNPCVWMRENPKLKCYEYVATYVDDLCIAAQNPGKIIPMLKEDYKLKVKGDGPLSHHLGADYTRDKDKTLVCQPKKYIDRLDDSYHSMFKQDPPKNMRTPLEGNDHPEMDGTELLTGESIQHCLTMIGQFQWLVRFDIHAQVTTMSRFRSAPRKGHVERLQRIYGYVLKTKHYSTRYRDEVPDSTISPT